MMDIKGPEIRTGHIGEPVYLEHGALFDLLMEGPRAERPQQDVLGIDVNDPDLINDVAVGDTVLVDSGLIRMKVLSTRDNRIRCQVVIPGLLGNRRHINLPGVGRLKRRRPRAAQCAGMLNS